MYFDSHTHLNSPQLFKDYKKYIENFQNIWWKKLINVWVDYEWTQRALQIESDFPDICLSTCGFHPTEPIFKFKDWKYEFKENQLLSWDKYLNLAKEYLENLIKNKKIVAIWECGMDYHYFEHIKKWQNIEEIKEQQKKLFILQLELAQKHNLPIVIHSRDAFEDSLELIRNYKQIKIYFHCRGYGPEEIKILQNEIPNLWLWFDGNITYKKAEELRKSIKQCNLNQILLETDAPYLTPQIIRKEMNQPANVKYVYEYISDLLDIPLNKLQEQVRENFNKFYNL